MGCRGLFNGCANGRDLSSAAIVVPLAADEGVTQVYLGQDISDNGQVKGEIVDVSNDVLEQYRGENLFQAGMLSPEGMFDYINHSVSEALATISIEGVDGGLEDFQRLSDSFADPDSVAPLASALVIDENGIFHPQIMEGLQLAVSSAEAVAQSANSGEIPPDRDIAGYSEEELQAVLTNWAEEANQTVDRMHLATDIAGYRQDLLADIAGHSGFTPEVEQVLLDDIKHGSMDGHATYDDAKDYDSNMTMVPSQ